MEISCAFATGADTPEQIVLAERLGYRRAWCYDSPALYPDVWVTLALTAERTSRIGLGPGVLIPSLRHVMTNAAAVATLAHLAPGRLVVAVGSGFTGRMTLGQKPLRWSYVAAYIRALRGLLRGEAVEWEGAFIRMLHPSGFAPPRPIEVPLLVGADGPKGEAVARELGDGVFTTRPRGGFAWVAQLAMGTVLEAGEPPGSERVLAAAGHAGAVAYHGLYARGGDPSALPGGAEWRRLVEQVPESTRHLATHEGHLIAPNPIDQQVLSGELLTRLGVALDAEGWRARLARVEQNGVTEVAYQPAGPDIERELTAFARVAGLGGSRQ